MNDNTLRPVGLVDKTGRSDTDDVKTGRSDLVPGNDHQAGEALAAKLRRGNGPLSKRWSVEDLTAKLREEETLYRKHAIKAFEHAVQTGRYLFAIQQKLGHGHWGRWCEANDVHLKWAEKRIRVAMWIDYLPADNEGLPWSLSAAYDFLPRLKDQLWEQHGIDAAEVPVDFSDLEQEPTGPAPKRRRQVRGDRVRAGMQRSVNTITQNMRREILDNGRHDLLELVNHLQAELEAIAREVRS